MHFKNSLYTAIIASCILTSVSSTAQSTAAFETPPIRKASAILPPALIKGEHFTVNDQVGWKEGLHLFTVDSDFGPFEVWGEPMLRVCLREVDALHTLKQTSNATVGTSAAAEQVGKSFASLGKAFRHPVETGKALPGGVKRLFRSVKDDVKSLSSTGKTVVRVNPKFYRPAEVELLIGDPAKAKEKLGWEPTATLEELCKMMVEADLRRNKAGFSF